MEILIRNELEKDYESISNIHIENFKHDVEAKLINELRTLPGYQSDFSQVAVIDNQVVGHIMLTPVKIANCDEEIDAMIIAPLGIKKEFQGQGLGTLLMNKVIEVIKDKGFQIALLYGGEYYYRFGFEKAKYVFRPNPMPGHGILIRTFGNKSNEDIKGVIHYPHPFDPLINEWKGM